MHNDVDTGDPNPSSPPFIKKGGIPLFGKEGSGEIFGGICLLNYGLLYKMARQNNDAASDDLTFPPTDPIPDGLLVWKLPALLIAKSVPDQERRTIL